MGNIHKLPTNTIMNRLKFHPFIIVSLLGNGKKQIGLFIDIVAFIINYSVVEQILGGKVVTMPVHAELQMGKLSDRLLKHFGHVVVELFGIRLGVHDHDGLFGPGGKAVDLAFEFDHKVIVEQGIKGREIECAVLGNDNPQASTCGEIVLTSDFYAYDTKYIDEDGAKVVVPAAIAPEINDKIRAIAVQAYQTLGCAGMARVDVFLTPENEVVINEINTLPGFTNISMYPKLWQASGLGYTDLITRLIELALERHAADNALKTTM